MKVEGKISEGDGWKMKRERFLFFLPFLFFFFRKYKQASDAKERPKGRTLEIVGKELRHKDVLRQNKERIKVYLVLVGFSYTPERKRYACASEAMRFASTVITDSKRHRGICQRWESPKVHPLPR